MTSDTGGTLEIEDVKDRVIRGRKIEGLDQKFLDALGKTIFAYHQTTLQQLNKIVESKPRSRADHRRNRRITKIFDLANFNEEDQIKTWRDEPKGIVSLLLEIAECDILYEILHYGHQSVHDGDIVHLKLSEKFGVCIWVNGRLQLVGRSPPECFYWPKYPSDYWKPWIFNHRFNLCLKSCIYHRFTNHFMIIGKENRNGSIRLMVYGEDRDDNELNLWFQLITAPNAGILIARSDPNLVINTQIIDYGKSWRKFMCTLNECDSILEPVLKELKETKHEDTIDPLDILRLTTWQNIDVEKTAMFCWTRSCREQVTNPEVISERHIMLQRLKDKASTRLKEMESWMLEHRIVPVREIIHIIQEYIYWR